MKTTASTEKLWTCFKTTLLHTTEKCIPYKQAPPKCNYPGSQLSSDVSLINRTYNKWKKLGTDDLKNQVYACRLEAQQHLDAELTGTTLTAH